MSARRCVFSRALSLYFSIACCQNIKQVPSTSAWIFRPSAGDWTKTDPTEWNKECLDNVCTQETSVFHSPLPHLGYCDGHGANFTVCDSDNGASVVCPWCRRSVRLHLTRVESRSGSIKTFLTVWPVWLKCKLCVYSGPLIGILSVHRLRSDSR